MEQKAIRIEAETARIEEEARRDDKRRHYSEDEDDRDAKRKRPARQR